MSSAKQSGVEIFPDDLMTSVEKDFFFDGMTLPASVYLKMKSTNYLVVGKKGDKANFSNLHSFQNDTVKFFVKSHEYNHLVDVITNLTSKVVGQKNVPEAVRAKFISGLAEDAMTSLEKSGFTSAAKIQKVGQFIDQMSKTFPGFQSITEIVKTYPGSGTKHAMTTCMIAMMLCDEMQINLPLAREKVAMGALLHDVGMRFVPESITNSPRHVWSQSDIEIYEAHPVKGVELLRDVKDIPSDVLLIISEHHENAVGTGFPKRLRDIKISPLGKVVGVANIFADLLFSQKKDAKLYNADEAIHYIEDILGQPYNKQVFLALKNIVNKNAMVEKKSKPGS